MVGVISLIVVAEKGMIEPTLKKDRGKRHRNSEQRQHPEVTRVKFARIDGYQHQPKRAVDHAANAEDQRVLNGLCDLVVYRGWNSAFE